MEENKANSHGKETVFDICETAKKTIGNQFFLFVGKGSAVRLCCLQRKFNRVDENEIQTFKGARSSNVTA